MNQTGRILAGCVLLVLSFLDIWTTYEVLDLGGSEANPVVATFIDNRPLTWTIKLTLPVLTLALALLARARWADVALVSLCVLMTYVVVHNFQIMNLASQISP